MALLTDIHRVDDEPFAFLRTGATADGVGDCLDYWVRSLRWAKPTRPVPLTEEAEAWLATNRPTVTALSWGDSRLPNVIYRDLHAGRAARLGSRLAGRAADRHRVVDPDDPAGQPPARRHRIQ